MSEFVLSGSQSFDLVHRKSTRLLAINISAVSAYVI